MTARLFERLSESENCLSGGCANEIENALQSGGLWAKAQVTKVIAVSPFSALNALRQIRTGKYLDSINEASKIEYRITSRLLITRSFEEGFRANLSDTEFCQDWIPSSLKPVTLDDVAKFFRPCGSVELSLNNQSTF